MSTNINNYFSKGPQGTLAFLPKSNLSYKGERVPIYGNTEIDRWYVGDFSSASYYIVVEYDSNQKESMQAMVVARPEHASITIFGRTSIEDELVDITATVSASYLSLIATPKDPAFAGAKLSLMATYAETISPLSAPTIVASPGGGGGGGGAPITASSYGTIFVSGQDDLIADGESASLNIVSGTGIALTTDSNTSSLTIQSDLASFKNVSVTGQSTVIADSPTDTLNLVAGTGITITTTPGTDTITFTSSGTFTEINATGASTFTDISMSGDHEIAGDLSVNGTSTLNNLIISGNLTINGNTTTINSTTLDIDDINITLGKGAVTSAAVDGGGITLDGAYATFVWDNSSSSWSSNKSIIPSTNDTINLGTSGKKWNTIYATSFNGTLTTPSQNNITAVGTLNSLTVSGTTIANGGIATSTITSTGLADLLTTTETVIDVTSATTVTYNFTSGAVFYHSTSPSADWTVNFTNLPTTNGKVTTVNIIVPQGSTAYKITAATIDGTVTAIKWVGSSVPTGNNSKTDIWSFSFLRRANGWTIYGAQSANFG